VAGAPAGNSAPVCVPVIRHSAATRPAGSSTSGSPIAVKRRSGKAAQDASKKPCAPASWVSSAGSDGSIQLNSAASSSSTSASSLPFQTAKYREGYRASDCVTDVDIVPPRRDSTRALKY